MSEKIDGRLLKAALAAGTEHVSRGAERINALNVFPVPDGDADADRELVTLYYGADMTAEQAQNLLDRLHARRGGLEFEAVFGGQHTHPVLASIE